MRDTYWLDMQDWVLEEVQVVIQQAYERTAGTEGLLPKWHGTDLYRIKMSITYQRTVYTALKPISSVLVNSRRTLLKKLREYAGEYQEYMSKRITMDDFKHVYINKEKKLGYYSHKTPEYEICLDRQAGGNWVVYFCNKYEEVLKERRVGTRRQALAVANKYHRSFGKS